MAVDISMPQLSDTMSEGRILTWFKKEGDTVKRGEALAEVATDKADLEIESFHQGTLLKILTPAGTTVKVGSIIAVIGEAGEQAGQKPEQPAPVEVPQEEKSQAAVASQAAPAQAEAAPAQKPAEEPRPAPPAEDHAAGRMKISPLAKNIAAAYGVDFAKLKGTGEGGRIVKRDIETFLGHEISEEDFGERSMIVEIPVAQAAPALQARPPQPERQPVQPPPQPAAAGEGLSRMRQTIASRMVESKTTIPHFYMTAKLSVEGLAKLKTSLKSLPHYEGLTYNHLMVKAAALALKAVPRMNASFVEGGIKQPNEINVGIVTALPDGLLIPVVKRADELPLADVVSEAKGLVQRARSGRPKADDLTGGTFSISNVGMYPVESFSAIISPGQGGILAVSAIAEEPVIVEGEIKPGSVMRVTLSADHRIIDGVVAGEFLKELKRFVEDPVLLLA